MKNQLLCLLALCLAGIFGLGAVVQNALSQTEKKRYTIIKPSRLYLKGTTNVNNFTCDCEDYFPPQSIEIDNNGAVARFRQTNLRMTTRKFNCHNPKMDRDMHKALKAKEFPFIKIELVETRQDANQIKNGNSDWFDVRATVKLTITGVTKEKTIQARARKISENRFSLAGEHSLNMSEFGIEPPDALFGLIKVDDLITFHFDLNIDVEDIVE